MKKIAIVDLLFNWPPDGGARTDVKEILTRLNNDFQIKLFVPELNYLFPRGKNAEKIGIPVNKIRVSEIDFNFYSFPRLLKTEIDKFKPDIIFFTDGWFMKPVIINFLAKYYKYIIRFYAYEGLCLRQHGTFFHHNTVCSKNYLTGNFSDWLNCMKCSAEWFMESRSKLFLAEFDKINKTNEKYFY